MPSKQIFTSKVILFSILSLFVIKGVVLSLLMPALQNPDEQIHYGTVQFLAEPTTKDWPIQDIKKRVTNAADISTYGLSEEIIRSAQAIQFDEIKFEKQNIQDFSAEDVLVTQNWKRYIDTYPANVSGTKSIYYMVAAETETLFAESDIFTRIFMARLLAVLFGLGTIILAYLIANKIGLSEQLSLLFTALLAFQPMFSITAAQVNIDIALIFAFSLFLYAGVCILKGGLNAKNAVAALLAALLGLYSKGPGVVLLVMLYPLFGWGAYQILGLPLRKFLERLVLVTLLLIVLLFLVVPKSYLIDITNFSAHSLFSSPIESIGKYLNKTLDTGEWRDTSLSYWGHFGWLDSSIPDWSLSLIIIVTLIGFVGTLLYVLLPLIQKKTRFFRNWETFTDFLPKRSYLIFFLGMMMGLQVAIRFYDWRVFDYTGEILIGQPGRYFLPNIIAHLLVIITGIGFLVRQESRFALALKVLTLAMILLQLHAIVNVIIPRYYL